MKIINGPYGARYVDREATQYNQLVDGNIIQPKVADWLGPDENLGQHIIPQQNMMCAKNGKKFKGVMEYHFWNPKNDSELKSELPYILNNIYNSEGKIINHELDVKDINILNEYNNAKPLAYLDIIESFKKGTGTKLINNLKKSPDIEGIILKCISVEEDKQLMKKELKKNMKFYKKNGFEQTGLYISRGRFPVYAWLN